MSVIFRTLLIHAEPKGAIQFCCISPSARPSFCLQHLSTNRGGWVRIESQAVLRKSQGLFSVGDNTGRSHRVLHWCGIGNLPSRFAICICICICIEFFRSHIPTDTHGWLFPWSHQNHGPAPVDEAHEHAVEELGGRIRC